MRFLAMLNAERSKFLGRGLGLVSLNLLALTGVLTVLGMRGFLWFRKKYADEQCAAAISEHGYDIFNFTDAGAAVLKLIPAVPLALVVLVVAITATLYGSEPARGTLTTLLLRPIPRWTVFVSKTVAVLAYTFLLLLVPLVIALGLGLIVFGTTSGDIPVECVAEYLAAEEAAPIAESIAAAARGLIALWFGLLPVIGLTALVAIAARSPIVGMVVTMFAYVVDKGIAMATSLVGAVDVYVGQGNDPVDMSDKAWFQVADFINKLTLSTNRGVLAKFAEGVGEDHARAFVTITLVTVVTFGIAAAIWQRRDVT